MESREGYVLALIGGILTLAVGLFFLYLSVTVFSLGGLSDKVVRGISLGTFGSLMVFFNLLVVGVGALKIWAGVLMRDPERTLTGGIIALVLGIVLFDPFSLIGGILGIVRGSDESGVRLRGGKSGRRKSSKGKTGGK